MKLRYLILPILLITMISACSSCGEGKGANNGNGDQMGSNTSALDSSGLSSNNEDLVANETEIDFDNMTSEQLTSAISTTIAEQVEIASSSRSKRVNAMIAGFELGMTKREVKKHMLRMKQKKHLVRVQKSANVFEYVYQLKLKSGKSNTYMDFEYGRNGGVYRAVCKPSRFKKLSKSRFMKEVRNLLIDWYGEPAFEIAEHKGCARYIWINGNRHIDLYCSSKGVEFVYTDLTKKIPKTDIKSGGAQHTNTELLM